MFTNFYMWSKKELDLYPTLKSKDKFNREKFKKNILRMAKKKFTSSKPPSNNCKKCCTKNL